MSGKLEAPPLTKIAEKSLASRLRSGGSTKIPVLAELSLDALDRPLCAKLEASAGAGGEASLKFAAGGHRTWLDNKKRWVQPL
ncbi:MAG: hypothetical protein LBU32_04645 [Clostridiales bacterium]|nr:hypothetical protein [Clostridiales bacterium]